MCRLRPNRPEDAPIGLIPVDAIYSPVKQGLLQGRADPRGPGDSTMIKPRALTIETNGTVVPGGCRWRYAARILQDQLEPSSSPSRSPRERKARDEVQDDLPFNRNAAASKVDELELSVRSANCLKNDNIVYIGDLDAEDRAGNAPDPELRPQVAERDQGSAGLAWAFRSACRSVPGWPPENIEDLAKRIEDPF
jgi:DNA-directed RNA polymerase subunit alpha